MTEAFTPNGQFFNQRQHLHSKSSVDIVYCIFFGCSSASSGAAIYCDAAINFSISSSLLDSCTSTAGYSGGIYTNTNTNEFHSIYFIDCNNSNLGMAGFIQSRHQN
jgi:hypothetical protein